MNGPVPKTRWLADLDRRFEQLGEEEAVRLFQMKNDDVGSVCADRFDPCIAGFTESALQIGNDGLRGQRRAIVKNDALAQPQPQHAAVLAPFPFGGKFRLRAPVPGDGDEWLSG